MRTKGFPLLTVLVILTVPTGCDNVAWGGVEFAVQAPPTPENGAEAEEGVEEEEEPLEPIELGPIVYLVESAASSRAALVPVAVVEDGAYAPLPDPAETPDMVERFPLGRWEAGTEFVVFDQGVRAGLFTADGSSRSVGTYCLPRAAGAGALELRPEAAGRDRFLAVRRDEVDRAAASPLDRHPAVTMSDELRNASNDAARSLITSRSIPWPPSIPGIRRRIDGFGDAQGRRAIAASFVFGDSLQVGPPASTAYSLFLVSREEEGGFTPVFSWYQEQAAGGKAFPGFLAAHDVRGVGSPDLVVEIFGRESRGLAILAEDDEEWTIAYRDPCASEPARDALRTHS